ncbi:T9SS type A sorting domain-containing protein [Halpernia sp.]|uniref:T9SS type A sorting domain-containing protein n=1 Tax=Halpernia sp. TaxID=2782209 RepID=UPI003A936964
MKKSLFSFCVLFALLFSKTIFSQTAPTNTRLFQVNTTKGSILSLVESSDNSVYHVGTINASEVGFDGLTATSVGVDDLFILKSSITTGNNVWFKTLNAGSGGSIFPRYVYVDSMDNLYVFANFIGKVIVGSNTINSTSVDNAFLIKIDNSGNPVWVNFLGEAKTAMNSKIKCVSDGVDTFLVYNQTSLLRLNDASGITMNNKTISDVLLKSVALKGSNIFVAGASKTANINVDSETITGANMGFVLKGDKNASFSASATTSVNSDINDIAFNTEGKLIITGFSKSSTSLTSENGTSVYSYNPNSSFENNKLYNFVAKIDDNLATVDFFRTSSPVSSDTTYGIETTAISAIIKPYSSVSGFNLILNNKYFDGRNNVSSFTNANNTTSTISYVNSTTNYAVLLNFDNTGNFLGLNQPTFAGYISSSSVNYFTTNLFINRLFTTNVFNSTSGNLVWSKQKATSAGGTFSRQFSKHLNSAKNDLFVSVLVEGNANFFGKQINNSGGTYTRNITRLGEDGLPKWFASFGLDSGKGELNVSGDYANVDKDDNFVFMVNTFGGTSSFTDGTGKTINFPETSGSYDKLIIKLDKDGNYLWRKDLKVSGGTSSSIITDINGDVYILSDAGFTVDGHTLSGVSIVKFSSAGNFIYGKSYQDLFAFSLDAVFDSENNLYVFTEPSNNTASDYVFDGITIPTNSTNTDFLMLKFNSSGDVIWGKNFYANAPNYNYAWPNDVVYDGQDFVVMGNYLAANNTDYTGLDLVNIPRVYPRATYSTYFAKVTTTGTVLWQKAFQSIFASFANYTNINIDENKNIYMYYFVKDKVSIDGTEYSFDTVYGNKVLSKLDTSGNLKYLKAVDGVPYGTNFIDVISNDLLNVTGFTNQNKFLNYNLNYNGASSLYVATFGNLLSYYLTPSKDYLALNNISMENNSGNNNTFSFDLLNNVDWNASSDQSWLNLSFLSLKSKSSQSTISGNGDAKISLTAQTNNTGASRTANVLVSGDGGVASKTIAVTQTATLATGESKIFTTLLYPNPTSDFLNIETQQKISKIEIYDMSGKLLKTSNGKDKKVSVSTFNKGMYLIKIHTENGVVNSKFIKN